MNIITSIYMSAPTILLTLLLAVIIVTMICDYFKVSFRMRSIIGIIFVISWFAILLDLTIFIRDKTPSSQALLVPFWCIREAWQCRDPEDWYLVIGNIAIFVPFGVILSLFFRRKNGISMAIVIGFVVSLFIECMQYVLHRGFFETDDLINNTLGCVLGYSFFVIYETITHKGKWHNKDKIVAFGIWIFIMGFFVVALIMGQPVFEWTMDKFYSKTYM